MFRLKTIWVFIETRRGKIAPVSLEILGEARRLAAQGGQEVVALIAGDHLEEEVEYISQFGPDGIIVLDDDSLGEPDEVIFAKLFAGLFSKYSPEVILAGATTFGRAMMPYLAAILNTGLTADCLELALDSASGELLGSCPGFGGNIMAEIVCSERRPQMATIRPNVFKLPEKSVKNQVRIMHETVDKGLKSGVKVLEFIKDEGESLNLEDADIIVGCGRGASSQTTFALAKELAELLDGAIGATRPLVDDGLLPYQQQIGQTGKTVAPKLYIACGISGAIHHVAGIQATDCIIAIDKDPDAPIFEAATYGIVGDTAEVLTALIGEIKKSKGGPS